MAKHFHHHHHRHQPDHQRRHDQIDAEAALDGIYVLRTSVPADQLDAAGVVAAYKNLAHVERDFRIIKADDLDLRPIHHRLDDRVKAHVLICMLACYLIWHLRKAWAPLTFTDEHPPHRDNPVAPAHRSAAADAKARTQHDEPATRCAASAACSTTWPPSPATRSASPAPAPKCPCSPSPPPTSAAPSTSSAPPSPSPPRSQNPNHQNRTIPGQPGNPPSQHP